MDIKNKAKSALTRVKNTVKENRVSIALAVVAVGVIAVNHRQRVLFDEFMTEKGIDHAEFYCPEFYAEKQELNS